MVTSLLYAGGIRNEVYQGLSTNTILNNNKHKGIIKIFKHARKDWHLTLNLALLFVLSSYL